MGVLANSWRGSHKWGYSQIIRLNRIFPDKPSIVGCGNPHLLHMRAEISDSGLAWRSWEVAWGQMFVGYWANLGWWRSHQAEAYRIWYMYVVNRFLYSLIHGWLHIPLSIYIYYIYLHHPSVFFWKNLVFWRNGVNFANRQSMSLANLERFGASWKR